MALVTRSRGHRFLHPEEITVSRTSALVALVASVVLVVSSVVGAVASRTTGVGENLDQITSATGSQALAGRSDRSGGRDPERGSAASGQRTSRPASTDVPVVDATRIVPARSPRPPQSVQVPSVGITMPVRATGVASDGQMELPADPRVLGWYRFGALPGDTRGSAVLAGHVDARDFGTGPLARLASVQPGAVVVVTAADGTPLRYRVSSVERITKAALPLDQLFAPDGRHRLALVTCGGQFLPDAGGYEDNIVVTATPLRNGERP
jgi:sortase (surface protein transpeptidase)